MKCDKCHRDQVVGEDWELVKKTSSKILVLCPECTKKEEDRQYNNHSKREE